MRLKPKKEFLMQSDCIEVRGGDGSFDFEVFTWAIVKYMFPLDRDQLEQKLLRGEVVVIRYGMIRYTWSFLGVTIDRGTVRKLKLRWIESVHSDLTL